MTDQLTDLLEIVKASDSNTAGKFTSDFKDAMEKIDDAFIPPCQGYC